MEKFTLEKEDTLLLVIDIQERLAPVMYSGDQVIENTNILLQTASSLDLPVIVTEQYPKGLGKTVETICANLSGAKTFEKTHFSACACQALAELDKTNKKKIIVTGMETHVCVFQTVRELLGLGYQVFVASDAVSSRAVKNHKNGLALMSQMGAVVTNIETIIFDLLKQAGTAEFKELSKLIK